MDSSRRHRTDGGTRRYSGRDIDRINRITMFIAAGLNLAGIEQVFALEAENDRLRVENRVLRRHRREDSSAESDPRWSALERLRPHRIPPHGYIGK